MDQYEKQFIKDITNEQVLKNLHVNQNILDNQRKIKNTYELEILKKGIDNKK